MASFKKFEEEWLRPFLFYGNNRLSLIGGALTSAAAFVLIGYWVVDLLGHGGSTNPYLGIIFDFCLPGLFVLGLILIPIGMGWRRRALVRAGSLPMVYPKIDLGDPVFRHGVEFVVVATFINFIIVGTASYRGVAYMDQPSFCGQSCHVMAPEWTAYPVSSHSHVACTECHIASGMAGYVHAKVNGTKQLMMVALHSYPRPIFAENKIPSARATCLHCHNPDQYIGDKLIVKTSYGDDEKNSMTRTLLLLHVGGREANEALSGIHGAHLGHVEYISTDAEHQTIPWVASIHADGSQTVYVSSDAKGPVTGQKRSMDCIDCHNRAAHSFETPAEAVNGAMAVGTLNPALPYLHKQGLALIQAVYGSQADAERKIPAALASYYQAQYPAVWSQQRAQIEQAGRELVTLYRENVFPFMKVAWGTHPNNLGHTDSPGCFRCHDGNHNAKNGTSITNDCSICHNLLAVDEANPKQFAALGMQ